MLILDTIWLTGMYGNIGIVLGEDSITGEKKAYIGVHTGHDEDSDREMVASGGAKLRKETVESILRHFDKEEEE
ncbi:hypothetical protein LCGC14_0848530 [marine sediment metagenome]|uniref:Uncharacterized protein n=1 Tax=marine sediment metagenome TaxID=412755 RepID=A0A0F9PW87_9ZZZZ